MIFHNPTQTYLSRTEAVRSINKILTHMHIVLWIDSFDTVNMDNLHDMDEPPDPPYIVIKSDSDEFVYITTTQLDSFIDALYKVKSTTTKKGDN